MLYQSKQKTAQLFIVLLIHLAMINACAVPIIQAGDITYVTVTPSPIPAVHTRSFTPESTVSLIKSPTNLPIEINTPTASSQSISQPPEGKFLFVEVWRKIDGTGNVPGGPRIDKPTYSFDVQSKKLILGHNKTEPLLSPSDWGFVGEGTSFHGAAGGGTASGVTVIQQLPVNTEVVVSTGNLTETGTPEFTTMPIKLYSISVDGTIYLEVGENPVVLERDKSWIVTKQILYSSDQYTGKITITSSITNYGWLSMESINP